VERQPAAAQSEEADMRLIKVLVFAGAVLLIGSSGGGS
jgi:hypothetical protein